MGNFDWRLVTKAPLPKVEGAGGVVVLLLMSYPQSCFINMPFDWELSSENVRQVHHLRTRVSAGYGCGPLCVS